LQAMETAFKDNTITAWKALLSVYVEDLKPNTIPLIIAAIREFHDRHFDLNSRESVEFAWSVTELNAQLVSRLSTDSDATDVVSDLLKKTRSLALACRYVYFLEPDSYRYGERKPDKRKLSAVFDGRLEIELMSLSAAVFKQPQALISSLVQYYSDRGKLFNFLEKAAGNEAGYWAKILVVFVDFWRHGPVEIDLNEMNNVPDEILSHAFDVLKNADISSFSEYEQKAAKVFVGWWPQSARAGAPPPPT